ncbi:lysostaphin resistance A-like protein [Escherichia marmotae]|uniref:lysostaphin resistance A-like protein n=1 Tax=Escherichia marmotae TaxID=1499973 RepID=UPI0034D501CD
MVSTAFLLTVIAYACYFRKTPGFSLEFHINRNTVYIFIFYAIIVIILQVIAFFITQYKYPSTPAEFSVFLVIIAVIIAPVFEEFFFRGCLLGGLKQLFKKDITACIITSIVFCAMHTQYDELSYFLILFISSLLMSHLKLRTNGLLYPISLHSIMNLSFIIINTQNIYR